MTGFTCTRCGKCCISLGRHMHIIRSVSPFSHSLRTRVSGETLHVQVSPAFRKLFLSRSPPAFEPGWCPFLRRTADGFYVCTIYPSRPSVCRTFRCCTMRIFDKAGGEAGKVKGRCSLSTVDPALREIWDREVMPAAGLPEEQFATLCISILASHGYGCEIYDS